MRTRVLAAPVGVTDHKRGGRPVERHGAHLRRGRQGRADVQHAREPPGHRRGPGMSAVARGDIHRTGAHPDRRAAGSRIQRTCATTPSGTCPAITPGPGSTGNVRRTYPLRTRLKPATSAKCPWNRLTSPDGTRHAREPASGDQLPLDARDPGAIRGRGQVGGRRLWLQLFPAVGREQLRRHPEVMPANAAQRDTVNRTIRAAQRETVSNLGRDFTFRASYDSQH
jgi:hypothetical protein